MDAWLNPGDAVTAVVGGDGVVEVTVRGDGADLFPPTEQADARTRLSPTTVLAIPPDLLTSRSPRIGSI